MNLVQKVMALKKIPPFNDLTEMELSLIAKVTRERRYPPGKMIATSGSVLSCLFIVLEGKVEFYLGSALPPVIGIASMLFDYALPTGLVSGNEEGALLLIVNKERFFTIIHECPLFVVGLLSLSHRRGFY